MQEEKKDTLLKRWGPALAMMAIIFAFSSIPMREAEISREGFRLTWRLAVFKGGHVLGYALLAAALQHGLRMKGWRGTVAVLGLTLAYAISDELHQAFVPGRSASIMDVGIDVFGGLIGILIINKAMKILNKKNR